MGQYSGPVVANAVVGTFTGTFVTTYTGRYKGWADIVDPYDHLEQAQRIVITEEDVHAAQASLQTIMKAAEETFEQLCDRIRALAKIGSQSGAPVAQNTMIRSLVLAYRPWKHEMSILEGMAHTAALNDSFEKVVAEARTWRVFNDSTLSADAKAVQDLAKQTSSQAQSQTSTFTTNTVVLQAPKPVHKMVSIADTLPDMEAEQNDIALVSAEQSRPKGDECFNCYRKGHRAGECTYPSYCGYCRKEGHKWYNCFSRPRTTTSSGQDRGSNNERRGDDGSRGSGGGRGGFGGRGQGSTGRGRGGSNAGFRRNDGNQSQHRGQQFTQGPGGASAAPATTGVPATMQPSAKRSAEEQPVGQPVSKRQATYDVGSKTMTITVVGEQDAKALAAAINTTLPMYVACGTSFGREGNGRQSASDPSDSVEWAQIIDVEMSKPDNTCVSSTKSWCLRAFVEPMVFPSDYGAQEGRLYSLLC